MTMMLHQTVGDDEPESFCRSEEYWGSFGFVCFIIGVIG